MLKKCGLCKKEKEFSEFTKNKGKLFGLSDRCKLCVKQHRLDNIEKDREHKKKYFEKNKEKVRLINKNWKLKNKDRVSQTDKLRRKRVIEYDNKVKAEYYLKNKAYITQKRKAYREANLDKVRKAARERADYQKRYKRIKEKELINPILKVGRLLRGQISKTLSREKIQKKTSSINYIGTSVEIAKRYIERQFKKGMSWENHGEWHIDHVIPLASAKTEEELLILFHYTNLQPLWAYDNMSKSAKILPVQVTIPI